MRLRQLRKANRYTQQFVAEATGLSQGLISAYERGDRIPRVDNAMKLADLFHITIDELMRGKDEALNDQASG